MEIQFNGSAQSVALGNGYVLHAPGLRGTAELLSPSVGTTRTATRGLDEGMPALDLALRAENVSEVKLIDLELQPAPRAGAVGVLRGTQGETQLEIEVPNLGPDVGQVVLSIDDAGAVRWHLPLVDAVGPGVAAARGRGAAKRFLIPARLAPSPLAAQSQQQRSIFGAAARRLLKVLVYPITDPVIGPIGEHFAARWEERKRPYRLRRFAPDNYRSADTPSLTANELEAMRAAGPMLMFIHGTFSTAHGGFGDLPVDTLRELHQRYGARVAAFDHPTLADAPDDNVRWLLSHLPPSPIHMDIVCHSRGGLVARALAAQLASFEFDASRVTVRRIVFGGVPNGGTTLVDPDHMVAMIDRLTTALMLAPTGAVIETLEALVTVVKIVGHGSLKGLRGLASMHPKGPFLAALNQAGGRRADYFAVASNYEPPDRGLRGLITGAADNVIDHVFGNADNDLVVPTEGVWQDNGGAGFPLPADHVLTFEPVQGVMHTRFFEHPAVADKLLAWLT